MTNDDWTPHGTPPAPGPYVQAAPPTGLGGGIGVVWGHLHAIKALSSKARWLAASTALVGPIRAFTYSVTHPQTATNSPWQFTEKPDGRPLIAVGVIAGVAAEPSERITAKPRASSTSAATTAATRKRDIGREYSA